MQTQKITCDHCGAALAIEGTPKFVDCRFCGTSLRIVRTESAIYTEVHEAVKAISAEVSDLRKESKLRALDERWRKKQDTMRIGHSRNGGPGVLPTKDYAQQMGFLGGITALIMVIIGIRFNYDSAAAMIGYATGLFIATLTFMGVSWILHRTKLYEKAERVYLAERAALERDHDKVSATGTPKSKRKNTSANGQSSPKKSKIRRKSADSSKE